MKTPSFNPKDFSTGNIKITIGNTPSLWQDVRNLRKKVFCEEEGFGADMIETDTDPYNIHLALYHGTQPVAAASLIPVQYAELKAREASVPEEYIGLSACATKLVVLPQERGKHYSILMLGMMYRHVLFPAKVRYVFLVLDGIHCSNEHLYQKGGAFQTIKDGAGPYGRRLLMLFDSHTEEAQKAIRQFNEMW